MNLERPSNPRGTLWASPSPLKLGADVCRCVPKGASAGPRRGGDDIMPQCAKERSPPATRHSAAVVVVVIHSTLGKRNHTQALGPQPHALSLRLSRHHRAPARPARGRGRRAHERLPGRVGRVAGRAPPGPLWGSRGGGTFSPRRTGSTVSRVTDTPNGMPFVEESLEWQGSTEVLARTDGAWGSRKIL